jgi:hypothetical protein
MHIEGDKNISCYGERVRVRERERKKRKKIERKEDKKEGK